MCFTLAYGGILNSLDAEHTTDIQWFYKCCIVVPNVENGACHFGPINMATNVEH